MAPNVYIYYLHHLTTTPFLPILLRHTRLFSTCWILRISCFEPPLCPLHRLLLRRPLLVVFLDVARQPPPPFAQCASCLSTRSSSYICLSALFSSSRRLISQPSRRLRCCFIIVFLRSDPSRSSSSCRIRSRASTRVFSFCSLRAETSALTFFCWRITAALPLALLFFFLSSDAVSSAFVASTAFAALVMFSTASAATAAVAGAVADEGNNREDHIPGNRDAYRERPGLDHSSPVLLVLIELIDVARHRRRLRRRGRMSTVLSSSLTLCSPVRSRLDGAPAMSD